MDAAKTQRTGFNTSAIVGVLAIVVVAAVAWYFISDPFRTRVDATADQWTKWTPENIAKDPENYLNFCETETKKALDELKASEIRIAQSRGSLNSMKETSTSKVKTGETALTELKDSYRTAESKNVWPVSFRGTTLNQQAAQRQIVTLHKQTESERKLAQKVENGLQKLEAQNVKIQEARAQANEQLQEITTSRELLKVQKLTGDLQDRLVAMRGALQATVNTANETENAVVSLDQLASETAPAVDDAEFEKIMGDSASPEPTVPTAGGGGV